MNGTCCNSSEEATFVSATFLTQSVAIKLHHLTKIKEKYCRFEGRKAGRRMKKWYFGSALIGSIVLGVIVETNTSSLDASTRSIVLDAMMEMSEPLLVANLWFSQPQSSFTTWRKSRAKEAVLGRWETERVRKIDLLVTQWELKVFLRRW